MVEIVVSSSFGHWLPTAALYAATTQASENTEPRDLVALLLGPAVIAAMVTAVASALSTRRLKRLELELAKQLADKQHKHAQALEDHKAQLTQQLRNEEHELAKSLEAYKARVDVQRRRADLLVAVRLELSEALNRAFRLVYEKGGPKAVPPSILVQRLRDADETIMTPLRRNQQLLSVESYTAVLAVHNLLAQGLRGGTPSSEAIERLHGLRDRFFEKVLAAQGALSREGTIGDEQ